MVIICNENHARLITHREGSTKSPAEGRSFWRPACNLVQIAKMKTNCSTQGAPRLDTRILWGHSKELKKWASLTQCIDLAMNAPKTMCCSHVELFREGGKNFTSSGQTAGKQVSGSSEEPYLLLFPLCHGLRTSLTTCSQLPKTTWPGCGQNPLKLQAKINPSSFKLGFQVF